ncbi:FdtA/QdtA family cupin domain-containing protein [Ammoniphilus sp. 3BR4]|uniref:sugar 3,4-ketoisomerase n=1 Tax=Ammoniphilus sp. 3BR4 TaxID=3158265 RepID=UPI003464F045
MKVKLHEFVIKGDYRGSLIALESNRNISFDIKRVYYIFGTMEDVRRGCHAHRNLDQVLIAVSGGCRIWCDDGKNQTCISLDTPTKGLYIGSMVWREMYDFTPDCVLLVIANQYYDENDYIRSYDDFIKIIQGGED